MTARTTLLPLAPMLAVALLGVGMPAVLMAQGRPLKGPGYASPEAALSASVSAALMAPRAELVDGRKPWVPETDVEPPPETPSPRPSRDDWKTAPVAREVRVTQPGCQVQRLREWYRIHCKLLAIQLNAGSRDEVEFGKFTENPKDSGPDEVWVVFPARRNVVRYFQLYTWGKWSPSPDAQASVQWLDGDRLPLITVQGIRWGI